eukprot:2200903-Rhodomonas_salina.1
MGRPDYRPTRIIRAVRAVGGTRQEHRSVAITARNTVPSEPLVARRSVPAQPLTQGAAEHHKQ